MSQPDLPANQSDIDDHDVAEYLRKHPAFLHERPALLAEIDLPHVGGSGAASLIERQVSILRERNMDMRHRLDQLLDTARRNDRLFEKTRKLTLNLLVAQSTNEIIQTLFESFDHDFAIEETQLIMQDSSIVSGLSDEPRLRYLSQEALHETIPSLNAKLKIFCGQLTDLEKATLFLDAADNVHSAAVVPLIAQNQRVGLLSIGHQDPNYYRSSMDTLFLSHIADVFSQCFWKIEDARR